MGTVGDAGMVTGPHLHFECWSNKNINSNFNPRIQFKWYGITPGFGGGAGAVKPSGSVSKPSKPSASKGNPETDNKAIQNVLNNMGIDVGKEDGIDGKWQKAGVKQFQAAHGLVEDGRWGSKTQSRFDLNKHIQNAIKKIAGVPDNWKTDGFNGTTSKKWIAYTNKRRGW